MNRAKSPRPERSLNFSSACRTSVCSGYTRDSTDDDWCGFYSRKDAKHGLSLSADQKAPDIVVTLNSGRRLIAHVSRGLLEATRSPAEHKLLRSAIGRAITCKTAEPNDAVAAVVPRSKRFRELAVRWRAAEGVVRARVLILTVDRAGTVDGLPRDGHL